MSKSLSISTKGNSYNIPLDWNHITIGQFQQLHELSKTPLEDAILTRNLIISTLLQIDIDILNTFPVSTIKEIEALLQWHQTFPQQQEYRTFTLNKIKYGFISDLNLITLGEFIDLDSLCQDIVGNIHEIAAILYRPIIKTSFINRLKAYNSSNNGSFIKRKSVFRKLIYFIEAFTTILPYQIEKYDSITRKSRAELFQNSLSITQIWSLTLFFSLLGIKFTENMKDYSSQK